MRTYIALFLIACAASAALTPLVIRLCRRYGWVDAPGGRKLHRTPVPRLGGSAVLAALRAGRHPHVPVRQPGHPAVRGHHPQGAADPRPGPAGGRAGGGGRPPGRSAGADQVPGPDRGRHPALGLRIPCGQPHPAGDGHAAPRAGPGLCADGPVDRGRDQRLQFHRRHGWPGLRHRPVHGGVGDGHGPGHRTPGSGGGGGPPGRGGGRLPALQLAAGPHLPGGRRAATSSGSCWAPWPS